MKRSTSVDTPARMRVKVAAVGLRGIPDVEGGVESHAQNLYPLLAAAGFDVTVHARKGFVPAAEEFEWRGVKVLPSWSPKRAGYEALLHSLIAIFKARMQGADVLHIHAVGPAVLTPLARLMAMRVVVTHHGRDYEREKWGRFARAMLRLGERFAARYAHGVICVARNDAERLDQRYGRGTAVAIPNGIPQLAPPDSGEVLKELGLEPGRYVLNVARLVPEKRQLDLIEGFSRAGLPGWKLALVGSALNDSSYPAGVARAAAEAGNCVMCGTRKGSALSTLYANAGAFVLPSAHEGLPITLLEALSFGLACIASSIPANREVSLPDDRYFEVGDVDALAQRLKAVALERGSQAVAPIGQSFDMLPAEYQWKTVAVNTATVLLQAAGRPAPATLAGAGGDSVSRMEADSPEARPR